MTLFPSKDFKLDSTTKKNFAITMTCSQRLIDQLEQQTNQSFGIENKCIIPNEEFTGNIDCRYCGRHYSIQGGQKNEFWIGLYFNNIGFAPSYQLILAVDAQAKYATNLLSAGINYTTHNFFMRNINEKWFYVNLDNYLLNCNLAVFHNEISTLLDRIL